MCRYVYFMPWNTTCVSAVVSCFKPCHNEVGSSSLCHDTGVKYYRFIEHINGSTPELKRLHRDSLWPGLRWGNSWRLCPVWWRHFPEHPVNRARQQCRSINKRLGLIAVIFQVRNARYVRHLPADCLYRSSWRRCTQSTRRYRRRWSCSSYHDTSPWSTNHQFLTYMYYTTLLCIYRLDQSAINVISH